MSMRKACLSFTVLAALALLLAVPAFARDAAITNGIDLWKTPGTGGTFVDFKQTPLPAGFFCASSAPFTGRIVFTGVPVRTNPGSALGNADTIIQRLDDAVFTKSVSALHPFNLRESDGTVRQVEPNAFQGQEVATTRLQVKAISFASVRPVSTGCGSYTVKASLSGEQPITEMVIVREQDAGGRFYAPLNLNVKLTFTPVRGGAPLEVVRNIQFPAKPLSVWSEAPDKRSTVESFVRIDSDNDGAVDLMLPGTSNFAAGFKELPRTHGGREKAAATAIDDSTIVPVESYVGVPYCGGVSRYYAIHCHQTVPIDPVLE